LSKKEFYSFLGLIQKSGNLVSGYNNCLFEIRKDKCKILIIAEDASDNTKDKFISLCKGKNIPYVVYGNKADIGHCIGKSQKSVLAVKNDGMAKVVKDMCD